MNLVEVCCDILERDYADVNRRIDLNMRSQEVLGREIDRFIVANGFQSPELDAQFQGVVDDMDVLLEERHEIARKLNGARDMDPEELKKICGLA